MFRKSLVMALAVLVSFSFISASFAAADGNKRKGKYTYRKVYKACHERGEVDVAKPPINPDGHTQAEWTTIFESKTFDEFGCQDEWNNLDENQLADIYAYLHAHASDSPTPLKCK